MGCGCGSLRSGELRKRKKKGGMWCGSRKKEGSSRKVGEAMCGEGGRF